MRKYLNLFAMFLFVSCASVPAPPPNIPTEILMTQVVPRITMSFNHRDTASPTVTDAFILVGIQGKGLYAVDNITGKVLWDFGVKNGVESKATISDGLIYFGGNDGYIYCTDLGGSKIWDYNTSSQIWSQPLVYAGVAYVSTSDDQLFAFDAKTGKYLWHFRSPLRGKTVTIRWVASPEISDHIIFIGFSDGFLYALNRHDGGLVWQRQLSDKFRFKDVDATVVVSGNDLYVSSYDGRLYSLNKNTGIPNWFLEFGGVHPVAILDNTLYYSSTSGELFAVDRQSGKTRWVYKVPVGVPTIPVVVGDTVTIGSSEGDLISLDSESGEEISRFETNNGFDGDLTEHNNYVYGLTSKGFLIGVDPQTLRPRVVQKHGGIAGPIRDYPMIRPHSR